MTVSVGFIHASVPGRDRKTHDLLTNTVPGKTPGAFGRLRQQQPLAPYVNNYPKMLFYSPQSDGSLVPGCRHQRFAVYRQIIDFRDSLRVILETSKRFGTLLPSYGDGRSSVLSSVSVHAGHDTTSNARRSIPPQEHLQAERTTAPFSLLHVSNLGSSRHGWVRNEENKKQLEMDHQHSERFVQGTAC